MPLDRIKTFWKKLNKPEAPPETALDAGNSLTARELRSQMLLIGTPEQTQQAAKHMLKGFEASSIQVLAVLAPDDPLRTVIPAEAAVHTVTTPEELERALQNMLHWAHDEAAFYTPETWPFVLLVSPLLPEVLRSRVAARVAILRGHNFAVLMCSTPAEAVKHRRGTFGIVTCWANGFSSAREVQPTKLKIPPANQAALLAGERAGYLDWADPLHIPAAPK